MSRYKLKQWYPSLPRELKRGNHFANPHGGGYITKVKQGFLNLKKQEVENNPEYWEEIEQKKYEILSFKDDGIKLSAKNFSKGFTGGKGWDIYSVKRLSDSETFTIGDRVKCSTYSKFSGGITGFSLYMDTIRVDYDGWDKLENVLKVKEPLFTTTDGVDIYEGDKAWYVVNNFFRGGMIFLTGDEFEESPEIDKVHGTFSTKEKAEEYIEEHKPQYSKADINKAIRGAKPSRGFTIHIDDFQRHLKKL